MKARGTKARHGGMLGHDGEKRGLRSDLLDLLHLHGGGGSGGGQGHKGGAVDHGGAVLLGAGQVQQDLKVGAGNHLLAGLQGLHVGGGAAQGAVGNGNVLICKGSREEGKTVMACLNRLPGTEGYDRCPRIWGPAARGRWPGRFAHWARCATAVAMRGDRPCLACLTHLPDPPPLTSDSLDHALRGVVRQRGLGEPPCIETALRLRLKLT